MIADSFAAGTGEVCARDSNPALLRRPLKFADKRLRFGRSVGSVTFGQSLGKKVMLGQSLCHD